MNENENEKNENQDTTTRALQESMLDVAGVDLKAQTEEQLEEFPELIIPSPAGNSYRISHATAAEKIFRSDYGNNLYRKGEVVVKLKGEILDPLSAKRFASDIGENFSPVIYKKNKAGIHKEDVLVHPNIADQLLNNSAISRCLEPVEVVSKTPIITEDGVIESGCHNGTLVISRDNVVMCDPLKEAPKKLTELFCDYDFNTLEDFSRALSMVISSAMKLGGICQNIRFPLFHIEADDSQGGKGYMTELLTSIFNTQTANVTEQTGGTGSPEETIQAHLIHGEMFIMLDNWRSKLDSPKTESFLTTDGFVACRVPYSPQVYCKPATRIWLLTANKGFKSTPDYMNRVSLIMFQKQKPGYQFKRFPGDLSVKEYIQANRPKILGAIYSIIQDWIKNGKQRKACPHHDFKDWAMIMTSIMDTYFHMSSPAEGHMASKAIRSSEYENWLFNLGQAMILGEQSDKEHNATAMIDFCDNNGINAPSRQNNIIGCQLKKVFENSDTICLDGVVWTRVERKDESTKYVVSGKSKDKSPF